MIPYTPEKMETEGPKVTLLGDLVGELLADNAARQEAMRLGRPLGPTTGLDSIDEALGGHLVPGVHILQAAPGSGKTAFCLQSVSQIGYPALFVSAEMPVLELFRRLIARETRTDLTPLKKGHYSNLVVSELAQRTAQRIPHVAILDATAAYVSPQAILETAQLVQRRTEMEKMLVVIDSLQVWARSAGESGDSEYDLVNHGLKAARTLAATLKAPILAVSHRNRAGQKVGGMFAGKGSGDIEYAAETVMDLDIPNQANALPDQSGNLSRELTIHKNRHGQAGETFNLKFCGKYQHFEEA